MKYSRVFFWLLMCVVGTACVFSCQPGWVPADQSCYLFSKTEATWEEARAACFQQDANLLVIDNPVEFSQLSAALDQLGDHGSRWLGGYFLPWIQPYWFWEDSSIIPRQQYWATHKPPHHSIVRDRCVALVSHQERRLDNHDCLEKKKYICERNGHYQYLTWRQGDSALTLTCPHNQVIRLVSWKVAPSKYHSSCKVYDQATAYHNKPTQGFRDAEASCNMMNSCSFNFWFVEMWHPSDVCYPSMSYVTYGCQDAIECPPLPQQGEPAEWHAYSGHCYGSHTQHLPYPASERLCNTYQGGHLFSLYWEEEFMELRKNDMLFGAGYGDRLGIRFNPSVGEYTYADGHAIAFDDWIFIGLTGFLLSPIYGKDTCFYRPREVTKGVMMQMCADPNAFICKVPNQECINPVGLEDPNRIPNIAITASTYMDDAHAPHFGRLNGQSAWCAHNTGRSVNAVDFLQIDLGHTARLFGVLTQGLGSNWLTKYQVHTSNDKTTWQRTIYQWGNHEFPGNRDGSTTLTNYFRWITVGRYVRIVVGGWQGKPSLRVELLACRVNGGWSQWSHWGPCSSSCGGGRQQRSRSCSNPPALYGGTICDGSAVEVRACSPEACPVNGMWSSWSPWGPCSVSCGEGNRTRTRLCDDPPPAYGGHACLGHAVEQEKCISSNCLEGELVQHFTGCFKESKMPMEFDKQLLNATSRPQCIAACMNQSQSNCTGIFFQDGDDPICLMSISSQTKRNGSLKINHHRDDQEVTTLDRVCFSDLLMEAWWKIRQTLEDGRTSIDLSGRHLSSATHQLQVELLDGLPFVTKLDLSWNSLQSLQEDQFRGVENLMELDLHGNQLSFLPEKVFSKLIHLRSLNLRDNNWRHIGSTLRYKPLAQPPGLRDIEIEEDNLHVIFDNPNDLHPVNIYQECGSAHYAIDTTTAAHVIIRELYYDLGKLNDYLNTPSIKKVSIFAQTVALKQTMFMTPVSVHFDLEIITREFWMDAQAYFQFDFHFVDTKLHGCDVWYSRSSLHTKSLTTVRYRYKNTYTVFIEAVNLHAPFTCHPEFGTIDDVIPGPDLHQLMMTTYCARQLMENVDKKLKTIRASVPWKMMTYVKAVTSQIRLLHHDNLNQSAAVANLAADQLIDWETTRANDIRTVPYLSAQALKEHLDLVKDLLDTFDREWKHLKNEQLHLDSRLISANLILSKSKVSLLDRQIDYNATVNQFQISVRTLAKIRNQYYISVNEFTHARSVFEGGLQQLKVMQIVEKIINFGKALTAAISAGIAGNPAEALTQVVASIVTLIMDMVKLMNKLQKLFRLTNLLSKDAMHIDPKIYVDFADIEEIAELSTKVIVWQTMRSTAESLLSLHDFQSVIGYGHYRRSLLEVAHWGEALSREAITHARLSTLVISKRYQVALLRSEGQKLQLVYEQAKKSHTITSELLSHAKFEAFNYQLLAIDGLEAYCKSHFYYYMKECGTTIRPRLADSLSSIAIKIQQAKLLKFSVLSGMVCPVQSTNLHVRLADQVRSDQCNSKICPVKQLKENHETFFEIGLDRPEFAGYQRVRIREIRIFVLGVMINSTKQELTIRISNDGAFQDRYRGSNYSFMSMPRSLTIRYRLGAGSFLQPGCIDGSHARYFSEMPPFSKWKIEVPKDANPDLDLSKVTVIDIFFLAYATRADQCASFRGSARKRLRSRKQSYQDLGESTISPECKRDFY